MARNVETSSINQYTGIRVVFSQLNPQNIANNTSTLRASVYQRTTGYSSSWSGGSTVNVTVDGQTKGVWVPPWNVSGQSEWHLGNVDFTVSHNSAGGKNASVSHSWDNSKFGQSASSTFYFDTIPRASSIGGINQTQIGTSMTVGISRKSGSFTHQVWYRLPGQSWVNLGTGFTTSATFTIPISDSKYITNSASGALEVSIQTKNGSTNIGSEVRKKFTVYVPDSVIPSYDSMSILEGTQSIIDYDYFIQNISTLKISILGAQGIHGSTIKSYKIEVDKQILNAQSGITQVILSTGRIAVKGTVIDSRNRSFSKTQYINVESYKLPQFLNSTPTFQRVKQNGVNDPLGQYLKVELDTVVSAIKSNNALTYVENYGMGDLSPNGIELASSNTAVSDLINITGDSFRTITYYVSSFDRRFIYKVALYDSSRRFIKYVESYDTWYDSNNTFDRPSNAYFVQFVFAFENFDNFDEIDIPYRTLAIGLEGESNKTKITIETKKLDDYSYTQKKVIDDGLNHKSSQILGLYDIDYSYNIRVLLKDQFKTTIALGVISEGKVAMQIMDETVAIGYITTEALRNLYVGEKGMQNLGSYYDKDGNELVSKLSSGEGNTKLASDRTKTGSSPVKVPDTNTIYLDVAEGQRIVMLGSIVGRTNVKTISVIFQLDGINQRSRGGTNSISWETINVFDITEPLTAGRYKIELMWYAQDSATTGYIRGYTSSSAIAFAI